MSTRAEIEAAIETLPTAEQKALLQSIAERLSRADAIPYDPVREIIGAFSSKSGGDTGRRAEDILYGRGEAE